MPVLHILLPFPRPLRSPTSHMYVLIISHYTLQKKKSLCLMKYSHTVERNEQCVCVFIYSKSMTNFEAYRWIISTNINLLNLKKSDIMCNIHILSKFPIQLYFSKVFSSRKKLLQFFFSKKPFFQNSEMKTTSLFFFGKELFT